MGLKALSLLMHRCPLYLVLLPAFFVWHGYTENRDSVPLIDAFFLFVFYVLIGALLAAGFYLLFRNWNKASVLVLACMLFQFFFGALQDSVGSVGQIGFLARYSFLLPSGLLIMLVLIIFLKRYRDHFNPFFYFVNSILLLFILIDCTFLIMSYGNGVHKQHFAVQTDSSVAKPDIYFIILDAYSGNSALKNGMGFDNDLFEQQLKQRSFHTIPRSTSNYNYTPFSLASILNMQLLDLNMRTKGAGNISYCYQMIRESEVVTIFNHMGYRFYNYSIFDFKGHPAPQPSSFLPARTRLITGQTFTSRLIRDIKFNVHTGKWNIPLLGNEIVYAPLYQTGRSIELTLQTAEKQESVPRFVYAHLMMPHDPYFYNEDGKPLPYDSLKEGKQANALNYIGYLKYCNQKILQFVDQLKTKTKGKAIIILLGDHGYRYYRPGQDRKYCFSNLASIYLPSGQYTPFYDSMSAVNIFPALFNAGFKQNLPLQADSTVFLWD